jgi:hypothetical protein
LLNQLIFHNAIVDVLTLLTNGYILFLGVSSVEIKMYISHVWENLIHMDVRTKDGTDLGNVISVDSKYLTVRGALLT